MHGFVATRPIWSLSAWIGFDNPKPLGNNETGGHAALPMWMSYMSKALKGVPIAAYTPPSGITTAKINPETGLREAARRHDRIFSGGAITARSRQQGGRSIKSAGGRDKGVFVTVNEAVNTSRQPTSRSGSARRSKKRCRAAPDLLFTP